MDGKHRGYGFRARDFAASRNDEEGEQLYQVTPTSGAPPKSNA
jgi:hypothetical protein